MAERRPLAARRVALAGPSPTMAFGLRCPHMSLRRDDQALREHFETLGFFVCCGVRGTVEAPLAV